MLGPKSHVLTTSAQLFKGADNALLQVNDFPADKCSNKCSTIHQREIYHEDNTICPSSNQNQVTISSRNATYSCVKQKMYCFSSYHGHIHKDNKSRLFRWIIFNTCLFLLPGWWTTLFDSCLSSWNFLAASWLLSTECCSFSSTVIRYRSLSNSAPGFTCFYIE